MRVIQWFNRDPKGQGWLADLNLKPGTIVAVDGLGGLYRYSTERGGLDHVLMPLEGNPSDAVRTSAKRVS